MARNQEKAQSMLNRWIAYKRSLNKTAPDKPTKKPALTSECNDIGDCERWRMQIIRDMGRKLIEIQNESLGEQRIRDLNDEINKMIREKRSWEKRIVELGGPDYKKFESVAKDEEIDLEGVEDQRGFKYKYFGAARNLPGVKELFDKRAKEAKKQKRSDWRGIDAAYYGYNDDEDTLLEQLEYQAEQKALDESLLTFQSSDKPKEDLQFSEFTKQESDYLAHVNLPSKQQIEQLLLEKKKQSLLRKYVSQELEQDLENQKQEVEVVLGKRALSH